MKSSPSHFRRNLTFLCRITLTVLLLLVLTSCSGGGDQAGADQTAAEAEMNQLKGENEKLRTELEKANEELKTAEEKTQELADGLEELREALAAMQEAQAAPPEPEPVKAEITPPERTPGQLLAGQWYFQEFFEDGMYSWTQSLVLNADGTGTISRVFYFPESELEGVKEWKEDGITFENLDHSAGVSWSLRGDTVHMDLDNGESVDCTYSLEQQLLWLGDTPDEYGREQPSGMEGYIARALYADDVKAQEAARMRRFLGMWYFDLITWMFNEDGTCVIDVPELAHQPAATLEYTYTILDDRNDPSFLCLMLDSEKGTSYFYPEFAMDGSMSLKGIDGSEVMKLTRQFDMNNCPISTEIIKTGVDVISGRIFYDMLGIEE